MLGAEFVAWTVVLVYIGAVVVLFLFGMMITRAPLRPRPGALDQPRPLAGARWWPSRVRHHRHATTTFYGWAAEAGGRARSGTGALGDVLFNRFVIPFEAVSFVLLAALIGGIVLARKDPRE